MGLLEIKPIVKLILCTSAVILVFCFVQHTQTGKRFMVWGVTKSFMFALDSQQFKSLYDGRCLVQNMFIRSEFDEEECELCENSRLLVMNVSRTEHLMDFLNLDIPIVVNNPGNLSERGLIKFADSFLSSRELELFHPCQFKSNIKSKVREHRQMLHMISRGNYISFYALWENCAEMSLKAFRQFYTRPTFLAHNVQLTGTNWALICSNYGSQNFKDIETFSQLVIVFVQKGTAEVRLSPAKVCSTVCSTISMNLTSGDTLLFSGNMYSLSWKPDCYGKETLIVGVGGNFD